LGLFVSQIIPRQDYPQRVDEFNAEVSTMVADFGSGAITGGPAPAYLVDHHTPFVSNPDLFTGNDNDYMSERLHPNDNGYTVMAETFFAAFMEAFVPTPTLFAATSHIQEPAAFSPPGPVPDEFELSQNYPNPFSSTGSRGVSGTTINFQLPVAGPVRLEIYDLLGRRVINLLEAPRDAGYHQIVWDGRNSAGIPVSPGPYFYLLRTGNFVKSMKMTVLR